MAKKTSKKKVSTLKISGELREALQEATKILMKDEDEVLKEALLEYLKKRLAKSSFQAILDKFSELPVIRRKRVWGSLERQIVIKDSFFDPMYLVSDKRKSKTKVKT